MTHEEQEEIVALSWRIVINVYDSQMSLLDTEAFWADHPGRINPQMEKIAAKWPSMCQVLVSMKKDETP